MPSPIQSTRVRVLFALCSALLAASTAFGAPGDFDPTFGTNGVVIARIGDDDPPRDMALQADGKIVVTGLTETVVNNTATRRWYFARFLSNGAPDVSFGVGGVQLMSCQVQFCFGGGRSIVFQQDGRIVVLGHEEFGPPVTRVVRLMPNGSFDPTFGVNGVVSLASPVGGLGLQGTDIQVGAVGSLVFSGVVGGNSQRGFVGRLLANGLPDLSFGTNGYKEIVIPGFPDASPISIEIAPDQKILVTGAAYAFAQGRQFLARLNTTGAFDTLFGTGGITLALNDGVSAVGVDIAFAPDGKIVVCGGVGSGFPSQIAITRFAPNGVLDASFDGDGVLFPVLVGENRKSSCRALVVESDGGIVVAGFYVASKVLVLRLLANGASDVRFGGDGQVDFYFTSSSSDAAAIQVQPDGKYVVGGRTSDRPGADASIGIARLEGVPPPPPPPPATPPVPVPVNGLLASIILALGLIAATQRQRIFACELKG